MLEYRQFGLHSFGQASAVLASAPSSSSSLSFRPSADETSHLSIKQLLDLSDRESHIFRLQNRSPPNRLGEKLQGPYPVTLQIPRRAFLQCLTGIIAAPAVIRVAKLMQISPEPALLIPDPWENETLPPMLRTVGNSWKFILNPELYDRVEAYYRHTDPGKDYMCIYAKSELLPAMNG